MIKYKMNNNSQKYEDRSKYRKFHYMSDMWSSGEDQTNERGDSDVTVTVSHRSPSTQRMCSEEQVKTDTTMSAYICYHY